MGGDEGGLGGVVGKGGREGGAEGRTHDADITVIFEKQRMLLLPLRKQPLLFKGCTSHLQGIG